MPRGRFRCNCGLHFPWFRAGSGLISPGLGLGYLMQVVLRKHVAIVAGPLRGAQHSLHKMFWIVMLVVGLVEVWALGVLAIDGSCYLECRLGYTSRPPPPHSIAGSCGAKDGWNAKAPPQGPRPLPPNPLAPNSLAGSPGSQNQHNSGTNTEPESAARAPGNRC